MAQHHNHYSRLWSATSQSVSQSEKPPSPKRLCLSNTVAAGFSLRKYGSHASWIVSILVTLLLTFFTNTDVMGKPAPLPSPSMGKGKGGGGPEFAKVQVQETYGKLPLYFIQNDGQVDEKVKFYEKGSGHATYFTKEGVYLSLLPPVIASEAKQAQDHDSEAQPLSSSIPSPLVGKGKGGGNFAELVKLSFLDANPNPEIIAVDQQEGKVNYFTGKDPKKWRTNILTYKAVLYKEVYPGIDIKFYGNNWQMEYDIIVKSGADPSKVHLAYEGIEGLKVTENGDLEIVLKEGGIIQKKPVIYQEIDGKRVAVDGRFIIARDEIPSVIASKTEQSPSPSMGKGRGRVTSAFIYTFQVASYDTNHPLVIDPSLIYSTYLGGSGDDWGNDIAVDTSGNAYVTGQIYSFNFPTVGPLQTAVGGLTDAFVTKIDAAGTAIVYSTYLGGSGHDGGAGLAVDASGNVYVAGGTASPNFPAVSPVQATLLGESDVFITKLDATGTALVYSTYIGGSGREGAHDLAVDASGNAYVTGQTDSSNFPTVSPLQAAFGGGFSDAFVTKLNAAGTVLVYSTYLGGSASEDEHGYGIAVDASGNAYVTGQTTSTDFPTASPIQAVSGGSIDVFVTKFNAAGTALVYSTYLGGSSFDSGSDIALDTSGNTYVTGTTQSFNFPTASPFQALHGGGIYDPFVAKLNAAGTALLYSTYLGGSGIDGGSGIAVDASGNAYVTGGTDSSDFPTARPVQPVYSGGFYDVFVTKLNVAGTALVYSTYLGGSGIDGGSGIAVDASGNTYVMGGTDSSDFPTASAIQIVSGGGQDVFVVRLSFPPAELPRTGQTTCYDSAGTVIPCAGTGQDGEIQAGVAWPDPRFTDNGDQTVTDNLTGLMWTKNGNAPGPVACSPAIDKTWQDALDYVACLNTNSYLGYTDWHMPNVLELRSLINAGQSHSGTWLNTQGFNSVQSNFYWSSTSYANSPDFVWIVNMMDGFMNGNGKSYGSFGYYLYVWPVRSAQSGVSRLWKTGQTSCYDNSGNVIACTGTGQDGEIQAGVPWPDPRFTDNSDGTVTDNLTGLMWTKNGNAPGPATCSPAIDKTWQGALDYVACLNTNNYLGYTDWRLPNVLELRSLINAGQSNSGTWLNTQGFNNVQFYLYWSSTSGFDYGAWVVGMGDGYMGRYGTSSNNYVWPVRSGQVGQPLPPDVRIDQAVSGDQRYPWADYNEATSEYLVLWQDKRGGVNDDIYGVMLDQNGNRIGSDFPVSTAAGHQQRVLVKAGGGGSLALWHDLRNQATNGADIYGAWIAGDGTVGPEMAICACAMDQWNAVAGYDPVTNAFLVVWLDARGSVNNQGSNPNDDFDLYGVVIPAGGSQSLTPFAVISANNGQRGPQIGYDYGNGQYYLAWNDRRGGSDYDIYGARLTTSGQSLNGTGVLLSGATGNQFRPTVTDRRPADGIANHLIAWSDYRSGSQGDVYGLYVDGSGAVVSPGEFAISSDPADEANVVADVDWINTKKNMVSWIRQQAPATYYNVVTGVVDQAGGVTGGSVLNPVADEQRANALTYTTDGLNDYGFLEVSADRRNGTDYDIWGIKVWP